MPPQTLGIRLRALQLSNPGGLGTALPNCYDDAFCTLRGSAVSASRSPRRRNRQRIRSRADIELITIDLERCG